jgi:hypothetical protein
MLWKQFYQPVDEKLACVEELTKIAFLVYRRWWIPTFAKVGRVRKPPILRTESMESGKSI